MNCEFDQCRNRRITLSPRQGFQLNCQQPGACNGMDLTLNVGYDPMNFGSAVSTNYTGGIFLHRDLLGSYHTRDIG